MHAHARSLIPYYLTRFRGHNSFKYHKNYPRFILKGQHSQIHCKEVLIFIGGGGTLHSRGRLVHAHEQF